MRAVAEELYEFLHRNADAYGELEAEIKRSLATWNYDSVPEVMYLRDRLMHLLDEEKSSLPLQR